MPNRDGNASPVLVDYSGQQRHTKHSTICVHHPAQAAEYVIPDGYTTAGVAVPSAILQRILREYKNLSRRVLLRGNATYIHVSTDARVSLHRSDNLFSDADRPVEPRDDDVTVELNIATLGRILKVTHFSSQVRIVCEAGRPVRLQTDLGDRGSRVDVYIHPEGVANGNGVAGGLVAVQTRSVAGPPSSSAHCDDGYLLYD